MTDLKHARDNIRRRGKNYEIETQKPIIENLVLNIIPHILIIYSGHI